MANAIFKCELCRKEVEGARLCTSCAEMVKRVSDAQGRMDRANDATQEEPEVLRQRAERAKANAEGLTPVVLG